MKVKYGNAILEHKTINENLGWSTNPGATNRNM